MEERRTRVAVLGATGPTGVEVVKQALAGGHAVKALVRDVDKMAALVPQHEHFTVVKVDLAGPPGDLAGELAGVDAVVSCLGARAGLFTPCTLYTDTAAVIAAAMRLASVKRILFMTAWGAKHEPGLPWVISWFLKPTILRHLMADMGKMEDQVAAHCGDLHYTVVRPPGLNKLPVTDKEFMTSEGQYVPGASDNISRADVARYMLTHLQDESTHCKMLAIAVPK